MPKPKEKTAEAEISVLTIKTEAAKVYIKGTTPLIFNAMSEKAKQGLLYPSGRKNAAARAQSLKHDPISEYRGSVYAYREIDETQDSRLYFPTGAFKKAIAKAALDLPGVTKSQIGRLCWIAEDKVPVFGVPQLLMSVVRSADMNHTPDIRTRAILPSWACSFTIRSVSPIIKKEEVGKLLAAAGVLVGIGDFRQEKGAGSYGLFEMVSPGDAGFAGITKKGGRTAQDGALEAPGFYDDESERLFTWFYEELKARGGSAASVEEIEQAEVAQ